MITLIKNSKTIDILFGLWFITSNNIFILGSTRLITKIQAVFRLSLSCAWAHRPYSIRSMGLCMSDSYFISFIMVWLLSMTLKFEKYWYDWYLNFKHDYAAFELWTICLRCLTLSTLFYPEFHYLTSNKVKQTILFLDTENFYLCYFTITVKISIANFIYFN